LAYMKVLANPKDSIAWHRILVLLENVGPKAADEVFRDVMSSGKGLAGLEDIEPKPRFAAEFKRLKEALVPLDPESLSVAEIGTRVVAYYEPILKKQFDNHPKRAKDLEHLLSIMERYGSLEKFLSDMALEPPNVSIDDMMATDFDDEQLVLSTIHSAKGLEWHTVFVIWTLEGRFPSMYATRSEDEMEEELRLTYVAASRARENLYFTYPINIYDRGTAIVFSKPSRFIDGISEDILEPCPLGREFNNDRYFSW